MTEDGLPLVGNTASTRPRLNLFGYDSDGDEATDSAYNVVVAEEDKGLGRFGFQTADDGDFIYAPYCDPETAEGCVTFDVGKNMWYHSFGMSLTDGVRDDPDDGLLKNLGFHGNMLNQPEVNWETGEFYEPVSTEDMWDFGRSMTSTSTAPRSPAAAACSRRTSPRRHVKTASDTGL